MAELINTAELSHQLSELTAINLRPVLAEIGQILLTSIEDNIEDGGRYSAGEGAAGTPAAWSGGTQHFAPLAASTLKNKKRRGRDGGKILQDSGRLMAAMDVSISDSSVEVTNNLVYFPHVTLGTKPDSVPHLPARPILVIQQEDIEEISITISEFIQQELR